MPPHPPPVARNNDTMTKTILLLSGWARSGKDAAAALLEEEKGWHRTAFAEPLKACVARVTGLPAELFHTAAKDWPLPAPCPLYPTARTPRDLLLQHALRDRAVDPDVYARPVLQQILESPPDATEWVISDWRYRREADYIAEMIAATSEPVRLLRGRVLRPGVVPSADPSEHDLDDELMDIVIHNAGSISDLRDALRCVSSHM
ncbi:hypothetical protein EBZ80_06285 [bacterium]|nr:hypothetical protein [bacterium]